MVCPSVTREQEFRDGDRKCLLNLRGFAQQERDLFCRNPNFWRLYAIAVILYLIPSFYVNYPLVFSLAYMGIVFVGFMGYYITRL